MKPLVLTVTATKEIATGISPSAVTSSPILFSHSTPKADYLLSAEDGREAQRIVLMRDKNVSELYVPEQLSEMRKSVLGRMASFVERTRTHPISLPRGWHQYKHNNLVAFFAVPGGDDRASRWITELIPGMRNDVILWQVTTAKNKSALDTFAALNKSLDFDLDSEWAEAYNAAQLHFDDLRKPAFSGVEVDLSQNSRSAAPTLPQSAAKSRSYDQWLGFMSEDQRAFVDAPTNKSIRLRGPAGSGKTVALTLKAVTEVVNARRNYDSQAIKVLIATHSWALAAQIDDSIESMGLGHLDEIDIFPLLEIAKNLSPSYLKDATGFRLIGEDSLSGKQAQLDEIGDLLEDFIAGDWITYRRSVSNHLRDRFESPNARQGLAWDLLEEFGSVIGAAGIFPGAGSEQKYLHLQRMKWMLPLHRRDDQRMVFSLYSGYRDRLAARSLITSDEVLADFLSYLGGGTWNRSRKTEGYDLIFVDEFHLFSPLERQVLHFLTRDVSTYPSIFMAVDPRQSPSGAFIGIGADDILSSSPSVDSAFGEVTNLELDKVHRFTPQILSLVKHIHHEYPTLLLGKEWELDFSGIESTQTEGPLPQLITAASRQGEMDDVYRSVRELYSRGRMALAILDMRQWSRFSELASRIAQSAKYNVSTITGRSDIEGLGYRHKGLVVGGAEYLAGLQFETVLVAGIPELEVSNLTVHETNRLLSLLYLATSRAEREVRVFVNDDDGGAAEVLLRAVSNGLMTRVKGSET